MKRSLRRAIPILLPLLGGCYSYVPTTGPTLERGTEVRARLASPGSFDVGEITANEVTGVTGEVVRWDADALVLSAFLLESASGREHAADGRTLTLLESQIAGVEHKRLAKARTGMVAGIAALLVVLGDLAFSGSGGDGGSGPGTGPAPK